VTALTNTPYASPAASPEAQLLEACCAQLEAELQRQTRVLESCTEQGRAARARDIESLELATRELSRRTEDALRAECDRLALTARLERHFEIAPGEFKLSALIARAPEPWRGRFVRLQAGLRETLAATRRLVDANGRFMREGARSTDRIMAEFLGAAVSTEAYDSDGRRPGANSVSAGLNVAG
jgi:hypothetical protein